MRAKKKLLGYWRELSYAFSSTTDLNSLSKLAINTLGFHVMNAIAPDRIGQRAFTIGTKIDKAYNARVSLRAYGGDVFVFYEVFADRCYYISEAILEPLCVKTIIDCGANIGLTALFFASRYPNASIISVEPHPENFALLKKNTEGEKRIVAVNAAVVGKARETVRLSGDLPAWGNKISEEGGSIEIRATTLSQLCSTYGVERVDLLKIDVEGAEEEIFKHADFLPSIGCGVIELHGSYSSDKFEADLSRWGYTSISPSTIDGAKMTLFHKKV